MENKPKRVMNFYMNPAADKSGALTTIFGGVDMNFAEVMRKLYAYVKKNKAAYSIVNGKHKIYGE